MSPNLDEHRRGLRSAVRRVLAGGVLATIAWVAIGGFMAAPVAAAPTTPAPTGPASTNATCAVTGYSARDDVALDKLVAQLGKQTAFQIGGTALAPGGVWTVPAGQAAVLVIDHEQPSTTYREQLTVAGVRTWSSAGAATGHRWISGNLPSAQSWTRNIGVGADVANCRVAITMTTGRGPLGTQVGRIGAALLVICAFLLLFVGRGRSRVASTLAAIPFGLLAGAGLSAVLYESGRLDPYGHGVLVAPVVGLVIALALPWSRRTQPTDPAGDWTVAGAAGDELDAGDVPAQMHVPVGAPASSPSAASPASTMDPGDATALAGASTSARPAPGGRRAAEPASVPPSAADAHATVPSRSRSRSATRVLAAVAAAVVCAGAAGAIVASRPGHAAANAVINPAAAAVIVAATWDAMLAGDTTHIDQPAQPMAQGLATTPKLAKGPLHDVAVGVPVAASASMFVATAQASVTGGGTEYVYLRYRRATAAAGWTVADLRYDSKATGVPHPAFGPDGSLPSLTGPSAATYATDYIAYLQQVNKAGKLMPNSTFATPPATSKDSFLVTNAPNDGTKFGDPRIFATWNFTDAGGATEGAVPLAGGGALVTFTVNVRLNIYNQTKPAPTACTKISITRGTDDTRYRELIENSSLPVVVTTHRSGKATIDDTKILDDGFKGVPC